MKRIVLFFLSIVFVTNIHAATERPFSWEHFLWQQLYANSDQINLEENVDGLMQIFKEHIWERYQDDEFELDDKRQESLSEFKNTVGKYKENSIMTINTVWEFGKYDFKKQKLPVDGLSESTYYTSKNQYGYWGNGIPHEYKIYFSNFDLASDIEMPKQEAKQFVKKRKDRYGDIDREISVTLKFEVKSIDQTWGRRAEPKVKAELLSVVYKDKDGSVIQEFTKK